jgi:hypothetical protein
MGWAEIQISAVVLLMAVVPIGVVIFLAGLLLRMRAEQARLAQRIADLEADRRR